ncbi:MAG TPA: TetR/AcrR family transcriptional regulator [Cyclobacteriaceae bacterium]|nr:TetR/AcrR family transcriptional regulator [Cyclobacteriaceae bacterium]
MNTEISERQFEIIEAAGSLLTTSGVGGLTIKNLAKEMKFSESAIYRHFTSKEEIIIALLEYLANSMEERFSALTATEPAERFVQTFQEQFRFFKKHPHFVVAVFSDGMMEESKRINETIAKIMAVKMKHLKPVIMQGQQKGIFTNAVSTDDLMHIVMRTFRLQMFKWRISNFQSDIKRSGDHMIQSILKLILTKNSIL